MQPHRVGHPHLGECGQYGERGRGGGCRSRAAVPREKTYKLSLRAADVYFEIYLASRRMTHDLVKLIYHLVVVLPKQLNSAVVGGKNSEAYSRPSHSRRSAVDQRTAVRCRVVVDFSPTPTTPHANEQRPPHAAPPLRVAARALKVKPRRWV